MTEFAEVYRAVLQQVINRGVQQTNKRTGKTILTLPWAITMNHDMATLPMIDLRRTYPYTAAAEAAWLLSGTDDGTWINEKCSLWKSFTDSSGSIPNAYGYRVRHYFGRDQLFHAMQSLRIDPSDRRQYISYWSPGNDGYFGQRNTPCPLGFVLNIVGDKLNMHVTMRSSDLVIGLPTDFMTHAFLLSALAADLEIEVGNLGFSLAHAHIYEEHLPLLDTCYPAPTSCNLLQYTTAKILNNPDDYIEHIRATTSYHPHSVKFNVAV